MKLFTSLGLVLALLCSFTKAQGSEIDITDFASKMWNLDDGRIEASSYTLNLQGKKTSIESPYDDDASNSLFEYLDETKINNQKYAYHTFLPLCDNYEPLVGIEEDNTIQERGEVARYLEDIMATPLMDEAFSRFQSDGSVTDRVDFRNKVQTAFFELHEHVHHEEEHSIQAVHVNDSCGFELTFCGEVEATEDTVHGLQNWLTFYEQEQSGALDYYGYIDSEVVNGQSDLLEVQFSWIGGKIMPASSMIVGVSTEFEVAIYMACFFKKPSTDEVVHCEFNLDGIVPIEVHVHTTESGSHISEAFMHHLDHH